MLSGQAQFSQADPMYVPISREQGAKTKVVAQVVARIAVWGVAMDPAIQRMDDARVLRGKRVSTQVRPMTAYTYTVQLIKDTGLKPDVNVSIIQSQPGTELVPLLDRRADFAMTLEPQVTKAVQQGAHVVFSYPQKLGDQIFTGLMTTEDFIAKDGNTVRGVVRAYQRALDDIRRSPESAVASAKKYFPQLDENTIRMAMQRMIDDKVIPESVVIPQDSWQRAIAVRVAAGDLKEPVPNFQECTLMNQVKADGSLPFGASSK
jgi:NitT/TauT family transport system substrate-binding protein